MGGFVNDRGKNKYAIPKRSVREILSHCSQPKRGAEKGKCFPWFMTDDLNCSGVAANHDQGAVSEPPNPMTICFLRCLGISAALSLFAGCYTVPETGRQSIILPGFDDAKMGAEAFAEAKAKEKVSTDVAANARVRKVGERIAQAVGSNLPGAQWEFVVFDAPETVNAFALPGGKVAVYTGLLRLAGSDDELAFVMGHEIAHVTSRHGAERMTEGAIAQGIGAVVDTTSKNSQYRELILAAYGGVSNVGMLKFSRSHESEADFVGLRYSAKAGYDPRAATTFWKKMSAESAKAGGKPPEFLSTHPSDERRIAELEAEMPQVIPIYEANRVGK